MSHISKTSPLGRMAARLESMRESGHALIATGWRERAQDTFAASVVEGLSQRPRSLDYRFLYDAKGSALFEQITALPEYYQTRTEAEILARSASRIAALTGSIPLIELGSGSSQKTSHLIEGYSRQYGEALYIPVDVSEQALLGANQALAKRHQTARIVPIHGTYDRAIELIGECRPALGIFLGSSIGNFTEEEEQALLLALSEQLQGGGYFLLGVDLVKDPELLVRAYDDASGVTKAFLRNLFMRMNRELGAGLVLDSIEHQATYVEALERVEIHARFNQPQRLRVEPLERSFLLRAGELVLLEICRKYRLERLRERLQEAGLAAIETFTDRRGWFALLLICHADFAGETKES